LATDLEESEFELPVAVIPVPSPFPCNIEAPELKFLNGISIKPFLAPGTPFTDCNLIEKLMAQLQAALAAISPLFLISDVLLAILQCIQAIPDAITSLSPQPLLECLENLIAVVVALLCAVYPPFAFPTMILSWFEFLIRLMGCVIDELTALCDGIRRLTNLEELLKIRAQPELEDILLAAEYNLECQQSNVYTLFEVVIAIIETINSFIQLANTVAGEDLIPEIPIPVFSQDTPCEEVLEIVQNIKDVLVAGAGAIKILDCDAPLGLGAS